MNAAAKIMFEQMVTKASILSIDVLKNEIIKLMDNASDQAEADVVFDALVRALERKMPSAEFIKFCDAI